MTNKTDSFLIPLSDSQTDFKSGMRNIAIISFFVSFLLATCASVLITWDSMLRWPVSRFCEKTSVIGPRLGLCSLESLNTGAIIETLMLVALVLFGIYFLFLSVVSGLVWSVLGWVSCHLKAGINMSLAILNIVTIFVITMVVTTFIVYQWGGSLASSSNQLCAPHKAFLQEYSIFGEECHIHLSEFIDIIKAFFMLEGVFFSAVFVLLYLLPVMIIRLTRTIIHRRA